jgi:hypothetical protein
MEKEYMLITWEAGSTGIQKVADALAGGWDIVRADSCSNYIVYILSRVMVPLPSDVNRVSVETPAKKKRK